MFTLHSRRRLAQPRGATPSGLSPTLCVAARAATTTSSAGALRLTRLHRRPQTIKPNPNETASGKFDKSFEKITADIESKLPMRQQNVAFGNLYDQNFGEESYEAQRRAAQADLHGREEERPAARQARSYFSEADLSPEALHVRSARSKVAQNLQRQKYDKEILKTTSEPAAYYYPQLTLEEKRQRTRKLVALWTGVGAAGVLGLQQLKEYMLSG